jgi:hypothetical protein
MKNIKLDDIIEMSKTDVDSAIAKLVSLPEEEKNEILKEFISFVKHEMQVRFDDMNTFVKSFDGMVEYLFLTYVEIDGEVTFSSYLKTKTLVKIMLHNKKAYELFSEAVHVTEKFMSDEDLDESKMKRYSNLLSDFGTAEA